MTEPRDPGRLRTEELYRGSPFSAGFFLLLGLAVGVGLLVYAIAVVNPAPRPRCPDGYALAGGGIFAGRLHCVPGAEVEWR